MDFCLTFHKSTFDKGGFNEIIIKYEKDNSNVLKFAQEEQVQKVRLILDMTNFEGNYNEQLPLLDALKQVHPNIAIMISLSQIDFVPELGENNIPFFFNKIAETWDELISLTYIGVKDVYVGSELGFEIKDVASVCHNRGIKVRVFVNVAQTAAPFKNMNTITSFFIRPEDLSLYNPYIDVVEFFGPVDRQRVLHEIYIKEKWLGKLSEIIIGLHSDIDNQSIAPRFAEARIKCKKKCNQEQCNLCKNVEDFALLLEDSGFKFRGRRNGTN